METVTIPFRLSTEQRSHQLAGFNTRKEIGWFGFDGTFEEPGLAIIRFKTVNEGVLGGGGTDAINGGVISAGFDAAFVLAGLAQYDVDVVVTLELSVQFLSLAKVNSGLAFRAEVVRSGKNFCFVKGALLGYKDGNRMSFALASGMVAPAGTHRSTS
jgi:acyl-coenzyme A thioesterase PaaI-like protein